MATVDARAGDLTAAGTAGWLPTRPSRIGLTPAGGAVRGSSSPMRPRSTTSPSGPGRRCATPASSASPRSEGWRPATSCGSRPRAPPRVITRHQTAAVAAVGPNIGGVRLRLGDGRGITLGAGEMGGIRQAHVVPPLPALRRPGRGLRRSGRRGRRTASRRFGAAPLRDGRRFRRRGRALHRGSPGTNGRDRGLSPDPPGAVPPARRSVRPAPPARRAGPVGPGMVGSGGRTPPAGSDHPGPRGLGRMGGATSRRSDGAGRPHARHAALGRQELEFHERRRQTAPDRARLAGLTAQATLRQAALDLASGAEMTVERRWREGHVPLGRDLGLAL